MRDAEPHNRILETFLELSKPEREDEMITLDVREDDHQSSSDPFPSSDLADHDAVIAGAGLRGLA
eukprot:1805344-Pyramimonas_sp.AAC.1